MSESELYKLLPTIIVSLVGIIISAVFSWSSRKNARVQTYQKLELASIDLFRFEAANAETCSFLLLDHPIDLQSLSPVERVKLISYITQILNLFEMAVAYRRQAIFPSVTFASWVAWFYETCQSPTFQTSWESDFRPHYSKDLADLIDGGIARIRRHDNADESLKRKIFYFFVAGAFDNDKNIINWIPACTKTR